MNWYLDGQHILALAGGTVIFATQALNFWRQNVTTTRVDALHAIVVDNDHEILAELSTAQSTLNGVMSKLGGRDRRASPPGAPIPTWANGGQGRRAADGAP